jgi:hypothetical protein
MQFGIFKLNQKFIERLNDQLAPFEASVTYDGAQVRLQLCPGIEVQMSQMHANRKLRPSLVHKDGSTFFYLNVLISTPHCDDTYGGVLGQTYKCIYVDGGEKFQFDRASEPTFLVDALDSVDETSFNVDASCTVSPPVEATLGALRELVVNAPCSVHPVKVKRSINGGMST